MFERDGYNRTRVNASTAQGTAGRLSSALTPPAITMLALQLTSGFCDRQLVSQTQSLRSDVTGFSVRRERTGPATPGSLLGYKSEGRTGPGSGRETGEAHVGSRVAGGREVIYGPHATERPEPSVSQRKVKE